MNKKYDNMVIDIDYMKKTGVKKLHIWCEYNHRMYWKDATDDKVK